MPVGIRRCEGFLISLKLDFVKNKIIKTKKNYQKTQKHKTI